MAGSRRDIDGEIVHDTTDPSRPEYDETAFVLTQAIPTLRQWASDAEATTVTSGNAVATLNVVIDRLGVFFDRFAVLLENQYGDTA